MNRAFRPTRRQRKAIYEKLTKILLEDDPIIYLYHRAHADRAHRRGSQGYTQMPDGLVRVVGLKLQVDPLHLRETGTIRARC